MLPDALVWIEIWGVPGKALEMNAPVCFLAKKRLHDLAAVDRRAVPDDDQVAADQSEKLTKEVDDSDRVEGVILCAEVELSVESDSADHREVIASAPFLQHGLGTDRSERSNNARERVEARLVYEEDGVAALLCPLLISGQRLSRQALMAASFRWVARLFGF